MVMKFSKPKDWRTGQTIFNFLEWLRQDEYIYSLPSNQERMADPFNIEDEDLGKLYSRYLELKGLPLDEVEVPMGVSQWRNHGEKWGYAEFWKKELAQEVREFDERITGFEMEIGAANALREFVNKLLKNLDPTA